MRPYPLNMFGVEAIASAGSAKLLGARASDLRVGVDDAADLLP